VSSTDERGSPRAGCRHGDGRIAAQGLELRHLRYFVAVADAGTFTQAAEQMFVAQPTLSQQVRRLEEIVGAPLLHRLRDGVRPTAAGIVLLEESRTVLSLVEHGVRRTRQAAGLGRSLLRVTIPPGMPEALAAAIASRLQSAASGADVDVAWLEAFLDTEFSLIRQRRADAGLGWLMPREQALPAPLDVMRVGTFEPVVWIPSSHPAARQRVITRDELAALRVVHGPRRVNAGTYDAWLGVLQSADPHFEFTNPPFQLSLLTTLAFAATASRPTAVLTGPRYLAGKTRDTTGEDRIASAYDMVPVRLDESPMTADAGLVWTGDLPRPLQQVLFDTADSISL
jgi:DNA-binding transcriptional LysR family regulator